MSPMMLKLLPLVFETPSFSSQPFDVSGCPPAGVFRFAPRRFCFVPLDERPINRFFLLNDILFERPHFNGGIVHLFDRTAGGKNEGRPMAGGQPRELFKLRL